MTSKYEEFLEKLEETSKGQSVSQSVSQSVNQYKLSELVDFFNGKCVTFKELEECKKNGTDNFPVYNGGVKEMGYYDKYNEEKGKTIMSKVGDKLTISFSYSNCWISNHAMSFRIKDNNILLDKYLYYFLNNQIDNIRKNYTTKGIFLKLDTKKLKDIKISLPNLDTQLKIVEFLDNLTYGISNLNKYLEIENINRSKQFKFYLDILLGSIEGEEISLGKLVNIKGGISFNKKKDEIEEGNKYDENEIYKLLTQGNISKGNKLLLNNKMKIIKKGFKEIKENDFLKKGEIMMCVNSINYIGKCVYFDTDTNFLCGGFMIRIETISNKILPKFLYYLFNSKHFLDYTKSNTKMSTIGKLSNNLLKQYTFKLPNLETQQKIVDLLDNFDKYISGITKSNFGLENLIKNNQKLLNYYLDKLVNF